MSLEKYHRDNALNYFYAKIRQEAEHIIGMHYKDGEDIPSLIDEMMNQIGFELDGAYVKVISTR